jgi:hypothetical protein
MTRAAERPTITDHAMPDPEPDLPLEYFGGETPDSATAQALSLALRAVEKFPELAKRYRNFAGPAAVASGALVVLAGVAVARRARRGQHPEQILDQITSDEIERAATVSNRQNRVWRMVGRIARRRRARDEASERR